MMTMSDPLNAAQTARYFDEHYSVDEYYTHGQTCVGQWIGKGAADLGLAGDVSRDDFSALLQGIKPRSGAVFIPAATHNGEHRAGWDSVFSAPKTVSIQALIGGDHRLIQAHALAVERALYVMEAYALARQHGGREYVITGNIVGARFNHLAARPADEVRLPDPQLHTHVVLLNMTRRPDGQWRSLDPDRIFGAQRLGSAVYRSELALEVQRLGYRIDVNAGNGAWELQGYTREQVMAFSARREQIVQRMMEEGLSGGKAAQLVALGTRQAKRDYTEAEMKADWLQRAADAGIDAKQLYSQALSRPNYIHIVPENSKAALDFARAHTTNREAVVDRAELEAAALQHGMGKVNLDDLRREITIQETAGRLIQVYKADPRHPQGAYTTDEMVALERKNIALAKGPALAVATPDKVRTWGEGKRLSAEQINAAQVALSSESWTSIIEGFAGATKTTTVGAVREFAEQHGYIVRGFAMTTTARKAMREAGIKAETIASLLANPLPSPTGPELWFVDESSLVSTVQANRIISTARELGIDRFVYVGDQGQHQSIEAGAPVRQLLAEGIPMGTLQDIRRQKDPELRQAVRVARDDGGAAFDLLQEQSRITEIPDVHRRYRQIAADYLGGHEAKLNTLVVSPGNDERKALNAEIRSLLIERGYVQTQGHEHEILVRRDLTPAQIAHVGSYREGDVIYCHGNRAQQRQGIKNNSYLTVEIVNRRADVLVLQDDRGRVFEASPAKWESAAEIFTQETRTLSVGDRIQFRHPDNRRDIANGEFASIKAMGQGQITLMLEGKSNREITLPYSALRHVDYGYTVTSFSSQGSTVDRVIVNDDSMRSSKLVNREQLYVSASRPRLDARIYTDDAEALRRAVSRDPKKEIGLDAVKQQWSDELKPKQTQNQSVGMRI